MPRKKSYIRQNWALPRPELPSGAVKSAGRVLQLLEYLDDVRLPVNVAQVAEDLGFPQSSASALLHSLEELGYLEFDASRRTYGPTVRVALLGVWSARAAMRDAGLLQMMEQLGTRTSEHVGLARRIGDHCQYIHVVQATNRAQRFLPIGSMMPVADTAAGLLMLSAYPDEDIVSMVRPLYKSVQYAKRMLDQQSLLRAIEGVRRSGYAYHRSRLVPQGASIAVPLRLEGYAQTLAVTISGFTTVLRANMVDLVAILQDEVSRFSGHWGAD